MTCDYVSPKAHTTSFSLKDNTSSFSYICLYFVLCETACMKPFDDLILNDVVMHVKYGPCSRSEGGQIEKKSVIANRPQLSVPM